MNWKLIAQNTQKITNLEDFKSRLLLNRNLSKAGEIEKFLHPDLSDYKSDFDINGIEKSKKRIKKAIKNDELMIIYGDYDVDGVCSSAILYHTLTSIGAKVLPYIPHREKEGYGLSEIGVKAVKGKGAKLIITVDNGIVALEQAKLCHDLGMDLIITDHHLPGKVLPKALAIIHSTKLCGAGVAWCLARKLIDPKEAEKYLDLVAVATICDLIPLTGVNRALVKTGLEVLRQTENIGIKALSLEAGLILGSINSDHISHILGPRLNAIGRLEHAMDALRLLCTKSQIQAKTLAVKLSAANDQKKKITFDAILQAKQMIQKFEVDGKIGQKVLILESEEWISGVIGLMAGRICEEYHLPTIIISKGKVFSKGSARSSNGINIIEKLRLCSDFLLDVGGHIHAAGFTIQTEKIDQFNQKLAALMESVEVEREEKTLATEAVLDPKRINLDWVKSLDEFEPFGLDNPKPLFESRRVKVTDVRTVGNGQHLKFRADGIDTIAFSFGNLVSLIKEGNLIDLAFFLEVDSFRGEDKLQFKVLDIKLN